MEIHCTVADESDVLQVRSSLTDTTDTILSLEVQSRIPLLIAEDHLGCLSESDPDTTCLDCASDTLEHTCLKGLYSVLSVRLMGVAHDDCPTISLCHSFDRCSVSREHDHRLVSFLKALYHILKGRDTRLC